MLLLMRPTLCLVIALPLGAASINVTPPFGWKYFYECGSGYFDCTAFEAHNYGTTDYTLVRPQSQDGTPVPTPYWSLNRIVASNHNDEAIGCMFLGTGCGIVYGAGGVAWQVLSGPDLDSPTGDINEAGDWVVFFRVGHDVSFLVAGSGLTLQWAKEAHFWAATAPIIEMPSSMPILMLAIEHGFALNEDADLYFSGFLYGRDGEDYRSVTGVLSSTHLPEPATFGLVAVAVALMFAANRRRGFSASSTSPWRSARPETPWPR